MISKLFRAAAGASFGAVLLSSTAGHAALTPSEIAQVRDLYSRAEPQSASRVRAMIARPDIVGTDAAQIFSDASRRVPFDDKHAAFVRDLVFGPASQAARNDLVPIVVTGLLARSAEVAAAAGNDGGRAAELVRIHRFVAKDIGGAGSPPAEGHDAGAAIRDDALRAAAALYKTHLALPVLERARLGGVLLAGRAQAELALVELASGLAPRADVAAWLGLGAHGRTAFEKTGVLVIGLDAAGPKAASVLAMLESAAPAARDASAIWIEKPRPGDVAARRNVLVAETSLASARRAEPERLWPSAVEPSAPDAALAEVAFTLGRASFTAVAAASPAVSDAAERTLARARRGGPHAAVLAPAAIVEALDRDPGGAALTADSLVAHAAQLLLLDAPRATSAALVRTLAGRDEPMEQLALALGVLATGEDGKLRPSIELARAGDGGAVVPVQVTGIKGTPDRVTEFTIDGHTISLGRDESGSVNRVDRDGKPPLLSAIASARMPTLGGETWSSPGRGGRKPVVLTRLFGAPEVGFLDDARFLVRSGAKPKGRDAVAIKAPGADVAVEADIRPGDRAPSLILLRASATATGYAGVALVVEPGESLSASLVALDGAGGRAPLGGPVPLPKLGPTGVHVKVQVAQNRVDATVGGQSISAQLPEFAASAKGDVAFAPGDKNELEVRNLRIGPAVRH